MKTIDVPGVGAVDFPEEMSDEDIVTAIEKEILPQVKAEAAARKEVDDYWSGRGEQEENERPGFLSNLARGVGERALDLVGGGLRTVGTLAEEGGDWLERRIPLSGMTEEQIQQTNQPLTGWGDALSKVDLGYRPGVTFEDVKENWWNIPEFALQEGTRSIPDMAAIMLAPAPYLASRTGEIAQTRAENDGRESATVEDLVKAAPAAAASALLERYSTRGMMGLGDDAVRTAGQLPAAMGRAAVREGATEFAQESSDYLGEQLGTQRGVTLGEGLERGIAGMVAGAPFGGGVKGLTGTIQIWAQSRGVEPTIENLQTAAQEGDTQAMDILRASGLMSDEQLAALSPEAAERFAARYQSRLAADQDPVLAAQRTQEARDRADLEGGDPMSDVMRKRADRMAATPGKPIPGFERDDIKLGGPKREDILRVNALAMDQVDAAIEAGQIKPEDRDAAIRQRVIGMMPELDTRVRADARTAAAAQARIDQILSLPADQHTPELATEYLQLQEVVDSTRPDRPIQLGRTRAYDKQTSGSTQDPGLARAVDTYGRQRMLPAPGRTVGMSGDQVEQARRAMEQPPTAAGAENLYVDPLTGQASRFGEVVPEQTGLALPSPATASRLPLTPEQVAQAQAEAVRTQADAARNVPLSPVNLRGGEERLPQTPTQVGEQRHADQAFRLVNERMRQRAGETIRDTRAAGRPEGGIDSQQAILLHEGHPVEELDRWIERDAQGNSRTKVKVRRYNPRTVPPTLELDENGESTEYTVDEAALSVGKYAVDPRQAQEFEGDPKFEDRGARSPVVEKYTSAITGKVVTPDAAAKGKRPGRRADEILGPPGQPLGRQTYRTTESDPTISGAEGPTSGIPGRGPVPRSPRPEQGAGANTDMGSGGRGKSYRGESAAEAAARRAEAIRRAKMREQSQRSQTQDEKTGEKTEWGKARSKYENQTDGYSSTAKGVDEDGWPLTDEDGFVLSDAGGPIRFEHKKDTKQGEETKVGVLTVLKAMRKQHPDAHLNPVAHPGSMRPTGPKSAESYWTIQATQPKPSTKTGQEQTADPETEETPETPSSPPSVPAVTPEPDPIPTPDFEPGFAEAPTPETPRNDTVSTPEQGQADTETIPVRNPEQLVASAEKALRDRQVKPSPKALARHFEIDEGEAANVLATIAGRSNKIIRQVKPSKKELAAALKPKEGAEAPAPKGPRYRLTPQFDEDMSLLEFLMSKGGLAANGDLTAMDAHRKSHPRYGNLVRKQGGGGLSLDEARELAEGEGYIGSGDDYQTSDIQDLLDAIEDELRGNRVTTERAGSGTERDQMEARARELGIEVNPDWIDAELMVEIGEAEAIANEDNPTVETADALREVVDAMLVELGIFPDTYQADFDLPFGDDSAGSDQLRLDPDPPAATGDNGAGSNQRAGEVGQAPEVDAASAPARAGGEAGTVRSGDRAAETRTGDAQEAGGTGRQKPAIEKTDQGDQYVLVGQASSRDGKKTGKGPQKKADEGLFAEEQEEGPDPRQIDLEEAIAAAKDNETPTPEAESDVPAKGEQREVGGHIVVATGNPDYPWAAGRYVEKTKTWVADKVLGFGNTPEEAAADSVKKTLKRVADYQERQEAYEFRQEVIDKAKRGQELSQNTLNGLSKFGDGKVTTGDAKAFLTGMGLTAKQADTIVDKVGSSEQTSGGAWLYDLGKIVTAGQQELGVLRTEAPKAASQDPDPGLRKNLNYYLDDLKLTTSSNSYDLKNNAEHQKIFRKEIEKAARYYNEAVEAYGPEGYQDERARLQNYRAAGKKKGGDTEGITLATRKKAAPKVETAPKPLTVASGVKRANAAVAADTATDLERDIYRIARDLERRKADKEKLAEAARVAMAHWKSAPQDRRMLGGLSQSTRDKDNTRFARDDNMRRIKEGEEELARLISALPVNPPKRKERAALLSRIFGRDLDAELTAEMEAADDAAWQERLEQIAPRADTAADIERILDENVARGILSKGTAKGIKAILGRMPVDGLKGVRLMIQDRMTPEEREILGTAKGVQGEYIVFDPDIRVLTVFGENGSKDAVETFVHENAHVMFSMISEQDKALARQIYDRLPISRQAMHTIGYDKDARFEEWFAESAVDYYAGGLRTEGPRSSIPHMLGGLLQRLYKRIVDVFSNEKAQIDAFFSGLERSLGYDGQKTSIEGITRRERRGVSTLAILSNPIGSVTGDWKAWKSGFQELARDVKDLRRSSGTRPNRQYAVTSFARSFFYSADGEFRAGIGKFNSPTLNLLADTFHARAGGAQGIDRKIATKLGMKLSSNATFDEAVTRKVSAELNQLSRILKPFDQDEAAMDRIVDLVQRPAARRSDPESVAAGEIARMLKGLHIYMKDAGVDVGEVKAGYFPREIDVAAVIKNSTGFVEQATKAYRASGLSAAKAKEAADGWLTNVLYGGEGSPVRKSSGTTPSFVQSRVLTKEADQILKEFYQRDPKMILGSYINRATKRAEIARRFGDNWKNWGAIEKQIREEDPAAAGMFDHLRSYAATAAGVQQHNVPGIIRSGSSMVRTVTSLSLLEKSTFSSLAEAIMPALRTDRALRDLVPAVSKTLREFYRAWRELPPSVAAELAADIGAIAGSGVNSIMAARFAGGDPLGRGQAKVLESFFRRVLLTQWTEGTRVASTERGAVFIRRLARDIAGRGLDQKSARIYMAEMGIQPEIMDNFAAYVNGFGDDLPAPADLDKGGEMGEAYRTALLRFVDQTVMRPSTTTRPRWASHPIGAVVFQLQAFSYTFSKNVLLRDARLAKTAWDNKEDMNPTERLRMAAPFLMLLPALAMVQFMVGELRDWLFMDPERRAAQTTTAKIEKAISRAGITGALDPYLQMVTSARYSKDPISTLTGPFFGVFGQGLGALTQIISNNSPGTNAAERKATEALYDVLFEPGVNMLLGYSPVSPLTSVITMGLLPALRDDTVDLIAGERIGHKQQPVFGLTELLRGEQFEGKADSWAARG